MNATAAHESPAQTVIDMDYWSDTGAELTKWITRTNRPASIWGHAYSIDSTGGWCGCGHFCGGFDLGRVYSKRSTADWKAEGKQVARERHALHLRIVANARRPR